MTIKKQTKKITLVFDWDVIKYHGNIPIAVSKRKLEKMVKKHGIKKIEQIISQIAKEREENTGND